MRIIFSKWSTSNSTLSAQTSMLLVPRCNSHSLIFSLFVLPLLLVPLLDLCQLAPHAEAAVLNCSAFAPPPSSSAQTHNNQRRGASNATGTHERHYEARLHRCFQANPYDTSQLPVDEDAVVAPFKIGYIIACLLCSNSIKCV